MVLFYYILLEFVFPFLLSLFFLLFVFIMFYLIRLIALFVSYGMNLKILFFMLFGLSTSFLPYVIPIAVLFACMYMFSRFSHDFEFVALQSLGLGAKNILFFLLFLVSMIAIFDLFISHNWAPKSYANFKRLLKYSKTSFRTPNISTKVFINDFIDDVVLYIGEKDNKGYHHVYMVSEKKYYIYSKDASLIFNRNPLLFSLRNGFVILKQNKNLKIYFSEYNIFYPLGINPQIAIFSLKPHYLTTKELKKNFDRDVSYRIEFYKRYSLFFSIFAFVFFALAFGVYNPRSIKISPSLITLFGVLIYWIFYLLGTTFVYNFAFSPFLATNIPNLVLFFLSFLKLKNNLYF